MIEIAVGLAVVSNIILFFIVLLMMYFSNKRLKSTDGVCGQIYLIAFLLCLSGLKNDKTTIVNFYNKLVKGYDIIGKRFEKEQIKNINNIIEIIKEMNENE